MKKAFIVICMCFILTSCGSVNAKIDVPYTPIMQADYEANVKKSSVTSLYSQYLCDEFALKTGAVRCICIDDTLVLYGDDVDTSQIDGVEYIAVDSTSSKDTVLLDNGETPDNLCVSIQTSKWISISNADFSIPVTEYIRDMCVTAPYKDTFILSLIDSYFN